jgi:PASTA domain
MSDQIVERIRAAAEDLTGIPGRSTPAVTDPAEYRGAGRSVLVLSAACVVVLLVGLAVVATERDVEPGVSAGPSWSAMTVDAEAGEWLDLPSPPEGLRQESNGLASTTVCLTAVETVGRLTCDALEGQVGSDYFPASSLPNADETEREIEIRTFFTDQDVAAFIERYGTTETSITSVRGTNGYLVVDSEDPVVVWSDRPGVIVSLRTTTASGRDPVALAEQLVGREWPGALRPPIVAVDFAKAWRGFDNNHPYALATTDNGNECISIGHLPNSDTAAPGDYTEPLRCTAPGGQTWNVGTVSDQTLPEPIDATDQDVLAGLVPASVSRVKVQLDDGRQLEVDTVAVPGLTSRAWGVSTEAPQGTIAVGHIVGLTNGGDEVFNEPLVALGSTVVLDDICFQPGTTGIVPDVVGQDLRAANAALRSEGLITAYKVTADHIPVVANQTPPAGTDVGCGDVVLSFTD